MAGRILGPAGWWVEALRAPGEATNGNLKRKEEQSFNICMYVIVESKRKLAGFMFFYMPMAEISQRLDGFFFTRGIFALVFPRIASFASIFETSRTQ
jgi:hypothetical protein